MYVANFGGNFGLNWAKAVDARGTDGVVAIGNPTSGDGRTKNRYSPLGITLYNNRMYISGDFVGTLSLDCITLTTTGDTVHLFIAELGLLDDPTTCRILTNPSTSGSNWNNPENWNGGIIPAANDSVRLPFQKAAVNQFYNPSPNVRLDNLRISGNQTLALQQNLNVGGRLDLLGGIVDAGANKLALGASGEVYRIGGGRVVGKMEKQFSAATGAFIFPVGTANGYSPVTLSNISGAGSFAVAANQGIYPNTANNLPANRANRWWNLTNGGLTKVDLTFQYLPGDITAGDESGYRAYRIPTNGGGAALVSSTINAANKTVFAPNVLDFSDWTLAQPVAPTAAMVTVSGRVSTGRRPAAGARVWMTDGNGARRFATTDASGFYRFADVAAGETYVFRATVKRFELATQVVGVTEEVDDLNFTAR